MSIPGSSTGGLLLTLLLAACAPAADAPDGPLGLPWDTASLWIGAPIEMDADTVPLFNPTSLQWLGASVVVVEPTAGVTLFDSLFATRQVVGRAGQGPGELRRPMKAAGSWPYLAVSDHGNQRATVFDVRSGSTFAERPLEAALLDGGVLAGPGGELLRLGPKGSGRLIVLDHGADSAELLVTGEPGDPGGGIPLRFEQLISAEGGPILVDSDGSMIWYDWSGNVMASLPLPASVAAAADQVIDEARARAGDAFLGAARLRAVTANPAGRLVGRVVGRSAEIFGLVADPASQSVKVLRIAGTLVGDDRDLLLSASAATMIGGRLVVVHPAGIRAFEVADGR